MCLNKNLLVVIQPSHTRECLGWDSLFMIQAYLLTHLLIYSLRRGCGSCVACDCSGSCKFFLHMYIYIYIYRERDTYTYKYIDMQTHIHTQTHVHIFIQMLSRGESAKGELEMISSQQITIASGNADFILSDGLCRLQLKRGLFSNLFKAFFLPSLRNFI